MTGQEERDVLFARLFGLTAVIQSGLLVRSRPLQSSASSATNASSLSSFQDALTQLIALGEKKSWIRESAWWTIAIAADALKDSDVFWRDGAVDAMLQIIFVDNKIWSPEKVALTLKLQSTYSNKDWSKFMAPSFKNPNLLNGGNLNSLSQILKVDNNLSSSLCLVLMKCIYPGIRCGR
jgi:DNA polymerase phi